MGKVFKFTEVFMQFLSIIYEPTNV